MNSIPKSQTISSLRSFVASLELEIGAKQSELQQVVGSKYNDFIESVEYISKIHEDSLKAYQNSQSFNDYHENLIRDTLKIFESIQIEELVSGSDQISCDFVWKFLSNCQVSEATVAILVSKEIENHLNEICEKEYFDDNSLFSILDTLNLKENVIEDCFLVLMNDFTSQTNYEKAIASIGLLSNLSCVDLFKLHLQAIDHKIKIIFENGKKSLLNLSSLLQDMLLDSYFIFFNLIDRGNGRKNIKEIQADIIKSVTFSLNSNIPVEIIKSWNLDSKCINLENDKCFKIFDSWLVSIKEKVLNFIGLCLNIIDTTEINSIQQKVFSSLQSNAIESLHAIEFMISPKLRLNKFLSLPNELNGANKFWEYFMKKSFDEKILKMLKRKGEKAGRNIKSALFHFMLKYGVKLNDDSSVQFLDSSKTNNSKSNQNQKYFLHDKNNYSSSNLNFGAQNFVNVIENELHQLISTLEGCNNNSLTFQWGLYVETNRLVSIIIILYRSVVSLLISDVKKNHSISQSSQSTSKLSSLNSNNLKILNVLLGIARSCSLMRIKEEYFKKLFVQACSIERERDPFSYSEYQIRSAFDIADTNGDGVLTHSEYFDAIQALGGTDVLLAFDKFNNYNITFTEFSLLCCHFSSTINIPVDIWNRSLDSLISSINTQWILSITEIYFTSSFSNIPKNDSLEDDLLVHSSSISPKTFKYLFDLSNAYYEATLNVESFMEKTNNESSLIRTNFIVEVVKKIHKFISDTTNPSKEAFCDLVLCELIIETISGEEANALKLNNNEIKLKLKSKSNLNLNDEEIKSEISYVSGLVSVFLPHKENFEITNVEKESFSYFSKTVPRIGSLSIPKTKWN